MDDINGIASILEDEYGTDKQKIEKDYNYYCRYNEYMEKKRVAENISSWKQPPDENDYNALAELVRDFHIRIKIPRNFKSRYEMEQWKRKHVWGKT